MVVQSLLPGSPPDLSQEGRDLAALVQGLTSNPSLVSNELNEVCPACKVEVSLQDITTATCPNGHTWGTVIPLDSETTTDVSQHDAP
jgi:general transcription factor 3C protein 4